MVQPISLHEALAWTMIGLLCPSYDTYFNGTISFKILRYSELSASAGLLGGRLSIAIAGCEDERDGSRLNNQLAYEVKRPLHTLESAAKRLVVGPDLINEIFG